MEDAITENLKLELMRLQAELEKSEVYQDIRSLERIIRRRGGVIGPKPASFPSCVRPPRLDDLSDNDPKAPTTPSSTHFVKETAYQLLDGRTEPVTTSELFESLKRQNVHVSGANPTNNLGAHLSRDRRFLSWGRDGWTLSDAIRFDEDEVYKIASHFKTSLTTDEMSLLKTASLLGEELPQEIDKALLGDARSMLGRHMTDQEKSALRRMVLDSNW